MTSTRSASIAGALTRSTMLLRSRPRSRNTRWSPNWRLPSTRHDPPAEALERDRRVDRDRRRADAALGAVVGVDAAHRRPADERLARREARDERLHPGEQLGRVERLDEVVVGARPQRADLALHVAIVRQHDDRDVPSGALPRPGSASRPRSRRGPRRSRRAGSARATPAATAQRVGARRPRRGPRTPPAGGCTGGVAGRSRRHRRRGPCRPSDLPDRRRSCRARSPAPAASWAAV